MANDTIPEDVRELVEQTYYERFEDIGGQVATGPTVEEMLSLAELCVLADRASRQAERRLPDPWSSEGGAVGAEIVPTLASPQTLAALQSLSGDLERVRGERDALETNTASLLEIIDLWKGKAEAAEAALAEAREALMETDMARKRLQDYANAAQRGEVQAGGRELSRKVWGAFAEYDAIRARTIANPDADREGVKL